MRVAALYDIHGNLPALEAVLQEVDEYGVDRIVVGGDVFLGPMPVETMRCLLDLDIPVQFIEGNCDREVLERMQGRETGAVPEPFREQLRWTARQLPSEWEILLASWPLALRLTHSELGEVLFCHAIPQSDTPIFTARTPEETLAPIFGELGAQIVVCGHTHMQFDRNIAGVRVVNAGSVGSPFGLPGAHWLLLGEEVEFRRTQYDLEEAAERIRQTAFPDAEDFAANNVLNRRSDAVMLDLYDGYGFKP